MKYIALDIGNVLVYVNFKPFLSKLSRLQNISTNQAFHFLERTQKLHDLGLTKIEDELIDHFDIKSEDNIRDLVYTWECSLTFNKTMERFIGQLNSKATKIALVSNIGFEHKNIIEQILPKEINFIKFYSCDAGVRKPSYNYYSLFLEMYPEFAGCVYLDDREENLNASKLFGFDARHFDIEKLSNDDIVSYTENLLKE
jgi:FMN phosphatase YigB (HAD superfamily)